MPRIALRLAGPIAALTTSTTLLTVASSTKDIIRHIHVSNPGTTSLTITISITADTTGTRIFDGYSVGAGTVFDHYCYYTLESGEVLAAHASGTAIVFTVNGDQSVLG